jgi:hypothetical protein
MIYYGYERSVGECVDLGLHAVESIRFCSNSVFYKTLDPSGLRPLVIYNSTGKAHSLTRAGDTHAGSKKRMFGTTSLLDAVCESLEGKWRVSESDGTM